MKFQKNFTSALNDSTSREFKKLAKQVEDSLIIQLKQTTPWIDSVQVTKFRAGSVVAEYDIIITDPTAADNVLASDVQEAVEMAIRMWPPDLAVDTSFIPSVRGEC